MFIELIKKSKRKSYNKVFKKQLYLKIIVSKQYGSCISVRGTKL